MISTFFIGLFAVKLANVNVKNILKHGLEIAFALYIFIAIRYYWVNDYPEYLAMFEDYNNENLELLDKQAICNQYLQSILFVCPSSIENIPYFLRKTQLLTLPFLAS